MAFPHDKVSELLAQCHRRCSICHRFCGVKMETDHILPQSEGGTDDVENAIPVCFECHAEIHPAKVCYMGDDLGDIAIMKMVGLPVAVKDAQPEVKEIALYITEKTGGDGAVREVCDLIRKARQK